MTLTIREAKEHCRVLHDDEDLLIQAYLDSALAELSGYIDAPLPDPLPADLAFAAMEQVAFYYDHRADTEAKPGLVPAAARICARYRRVRA